MNSNSLQVAKTKVSRVFGEKKLGSCKSVISQTGEALFKGELLHCKKGLFSLQCCHGNSPIDSHAMTCALVPIQPEILL